jgi:hypothetical protein
MSNERGPQGPRGIPGDLTITQLQDGTNELNVLDVISKKPFTDVRALGAVGDGATDDTAAIQSAISTGRTIDFPVPSNFYRVTDTLTTPATSNKGIHMRFGGGAGYERTGLSSVIKIDDTFTSKPVFLLSQGDIIDNLTIGHSGSTKNTGTGIKTGSNAQRLEINNTVITELEHGMEYMTGSYYNNLNNVQFMRCLNGLVVDNASSGSLGSLALNQFRVWRCQQMYLYAAISSGSNVVTPEAEYFGRISVGDMFSGPGVAYGSRVDSIDSTAGTITISRECTTTSTAALTNVYFTSLSSVGRGIWSKSNVGTSGNDINLHNGIMEQNPYHIYSQGGKINITNTYLGDGSITPVYVNGGYVAINGSGLLNDCNIHGAGSPVFMSHNTCDPTYGVYGLSGEVHLINTYLRRNIHNDNGRINLKIFEITGDITDTSDTVTPISLSNLSTGYTVESAGIPAGTTILAVNETAGTFQMSAAATANSSAATITVTKPATTYTTFFGTDVYSAGAKIYSKGTVYEGEYMPRFTDSKYNCCEEIPNYVCNGTFTSTSIIPDIVKLTNATLSVNGDNGIGGNSIRLTCAGSSAAYMDIPYYAPNLVGKIARLILFNGSRFVNGGTYDPALYCASSEFTLASTTDYPGYGFANVVGTEMRPSFGDLGYYARFDYPVLINKPKGYIRLRTFNPGAAGAYMDVAGIILTDQEYAGRLARYSGSEKLVADAIPTLGTWKSGEEVINATPSSGSYTGWVCTSSGTPGTWNGFGLIAAVST